MSREPRETRRPGPDGGTDLGASVGDRRVDAANTGRTAAPRVLRIVAAGGPDLALDGEFRFHRRLTVLVDARPVLADWVTSLVGMHAAPDTLLELDNVPARTYDLPRALRALPPQDPLRPDALRLLAAGLEPLTNEAEARRRSRAQQLADELARWESVLGEAQHRLALAHEAATRVDPVDLSEASRLRNEWRYAIHVDAQEQRRRSRREAESRRERFDAYLAHFGASSLEDLSMVGTGFGDTQADVAIREAATVVSMAEQRCHKLRVELADARRVETMTGSERIAAELEAQRLDLASLDAERADRLLGRALADFDDTAYVRPLVIDRVLDALSPAARRRGFDRLVTHARRRQIVVITSRDDVAEWAAASPPADVTLYAGHNRRFSRAD